MKDKGKTGCTAYMYLMVVIMLPGISGLTACGNQSAEVMIVQDLEVKGEADKVLSLEYDRELWMRIGTAGDNDGQMRAYIIDNLSGDITALPLAELEAAVCVDRKPLWEYRDADGDGRSDIVITGTFQLADGAERSGTWVYHQMQNGDYEVRNEAE